MAQEDFEHLDKGKTGCEDNGLGQLPFPHGGSMTENSKTEDRGIPATPVCGRQSLAAHEIARGTTRLFAGLNVACVTEFKLPNGQRADIGALTRSGKIVIVEIKSCLNDFRTDQKWTNYREYCDEFYFAVNIGFPSEVLPADAGFILADRYGAEMIRQAPSMPLPAGRRKALTLRFARIAARRLAGALDPGPPAITGIDPDD